MEKGEIDKEGQRIGGKKGDERKEKEKVEKEGKYGKGVERENKGNGEK